MAHTQKRQTSHQPRIARKAKVAPFTLLAVDQFHFIMEESSLGSDSLRNEETTGYSS
jgi:hypothetical protein